MASYFDEHAVSAPDSNASTLGTPGAAGGFSFTTGAHPDAIKDLEVSDVRDVRDPDEQCLICFDAFGVYEKVRTSPFASIIKMPCGHYFHSKCILIWLKNAHTCPSCRHKLREAERETVETSHENFRELRDIVGNRRLLDIFFETLEYEVSAPDANGQLPMFTCPPDPLPRRSPPPPERDVLGMYV